LTAPAGRVGRAVRSQFPYYLDNSILEVVCSDRADRTKVLVLKRAVRHLAAKDVAVFVERDDQRAAEPAEPGVKVWLLIFGMILLSEHQHYRRLIAKRLAPMCRYISHLRVFGVPLEDARHRRLYVGGRARLFF